MQKSIVFSVALFDQWERQIVTNFNPPVQVSPNNTSNTKNVQIYNSKIITQSYTGKILSQIII